MSVEFFSPRLNKSTLAWAAAGATAAIAPRALNALPKRPNHRGKPTPFPAGVIAAVMVTATSPHRLLNAGVAVLGLIDDLVDTAPKGLRGHARARCPTTGHLKAAGTLALAAATSRDAERTAVITLATQVFNVLDLRPGRAAKAFAAVALTTRDRAAAPILVLAAYDLRERAMLGDTGATLLGAIAGQRLPATPATIAALTAIALLAELTSLTALIDRVPPLRALDWLGRREADCLSLDPAPDSSSSPAGSSPRSARASPPPRSAGCSWRAA